jgi:hypothetical protein
MALYFSPKWVCQFAVSALALVGCTPKMTQTLLQPPQALGVVLAEEAARAAGANHQVAVISPDASWGPVSEAETAFREAMKKQAVSVTTAKSANLGNAMSFRAGLMGTDFLEALDRSSGAGAVVSFCGAPLLSADDAGRVSAGHPPILVVATMMLGTVPGVASNRSLVTNLLAAKIIQLAIIDGSDPAAPKSGKSGATHELFAQNYRILRPAD